MPKTPINYSKGLIYSIICKTDETLIYIGSTTNFRQRKNQHKIACHNEKSHQHNYKVYVMIRANGGWDNFDMKPVKEHACENTIQLVIEEERIRNEMKANLNSIRAFSTEEEAKEQNKKTDQKYRQEHKAEIKKYREEHKTENKEYYKEYREAHATKNKEYQKEYRVTHAAELKEKDRLRNDEKNKKAREKRLAKKKLSASIE